MAQLVIAAAGAALGGYLVPGVIAAGITGAQAGWIVGSLVGSAFAPAQKVQGPRLSDLMVSSSAYGTPIPYVQGSPRLAGQIIYASTKREIATTTRQGGKGGGGKQKVTTYTYEVDLLILLTDNVIPGITRIWSNGKLIWNKSPAADAGTIAASDTTAAWTAIRIYTGSASQLPDPTYEAAVGTANAPAYRGRGSVFIQGLQLGSAGQIPNLTFEIGDTAPVMAVGAAVGGGAPANYIDAVGFSATKFIAMRQGSTAPNWSYRTLGQVVSGVASLGSDAIMDATASNWWNTVDRLSDTKSICCWVMSGGASPLNAVVVTNTTGLASTSATQITAKNGVYPAIVQALSATTAVVYYGAGGTRFAVLSIDGSDNITVGAEFVDIAGLANVQGVAFVKLNSTQVLFLFFNGTSNPSPLRGIVLTVSGTTLTGTVADATNPLAHDFEYNPAPTLRRAVALSSSSVLYIARQRTTSIPRIAVISVSGSSITIGTEQNLGSTAGDSGGSLAKLSSGFAIATYSIAGAIKARVVGAGSAGSENAIAAGTYAVPVLMSSSAGAVVYRDTGTGNMTVKPLTLS